MNMTVIADHAPGPVLAIVERYEGAVNYLYPLLLNMSHKHRVLRDAMLTALFEQYRLFFIPSDGKGVPIGNLTSQLAANIYGHMLDRWMVHRIGITSFARYMDDVVVVGHSAEAMRLLHVLMGSFAASTMGLRFSHWSVQPASMGANFCGYRIWPTHKLLRRRSVAMAKRKIARYRKCGDAESLKRFLASWCGHARWANTYNLLNRLGVTA